jgi:hypothetical protein
MSILAAVAGEWEGRCTGTAMARSSMGLTFARTGR